MRKSTRLIIEILVLVAVILFSYFLYIIFSYNRLPDNSELTLNKTKYPVTVNNQSTITIYSQDIGFGAFNREFSFALNGGKDSAIKNSVLLESNISELARVADLSRANFILFQNVDTNANRSLNTDLSKLICGGFSGYGSTFAQNNDTPFLLYPIFSPVGKTQSGILTLYNVSPNKAYRNSLPFANSFLRYIDLDACYSVCSYNLGNKTLWIYNVQFSLLTDEDTKHKQLEKLFNDMSMKYNDGDYVICGGTFYYDLTGDSSKTLNSNKTVQEANWAKPFPTDLIPAGILYAEPSNKDIPTTRDPSAPYSEEIFTAITDGYFISDNIEIVSSTIENKQFFYSNHNPIVLKVTLK